MKKIQASRLINQSHTYLGGIDKRYFRIPADNEQTRNRKQLMWQARIYSELKREGFRWFFVTLTYDDEHLPQTPFSFGSVDFNVCHFNRRHITLFLKRLRDRLGEGIRYYLCSEYGSIKGRPHYHVLIGVPNMTIDVVSFLNHVQQSWYDEDTHDPLGFIMPNPNVTADEFTRTIYYLEHDFVDKKNIMRHYSGVEVKADQLPQMAAYVSKYVLKDSYFYLQPAIKAVQDYSLNKRQFIKMLNDIEKYRTVDYEHYEALKRELEFRYDLTGWLSDIGCFHRNSLGFGLDIARKFADFDDSGNPTTIRIPLGEQLHKKLNEGYNVGCKRNGKPLQCPIPDYIKTRLFYRNVKYIDMGQYHNEKQEDYYGKYKYKRMRTQEFCKHCELMVVPSIENKQSTYFRTLKRWSTLGNESQNELKSLGLPDFDTDTILDVSNQLAVYALVFRDTDATYPIHSWNDVSELVGVISKNRIYHNVLPSYKGDDFDVPGNTPFIDCRCKVDLVPDISRPDGEEVFVYNNHPIFRPLDDLLEYIELRMAEESYDRYMTFLSQHDKVQAYANKTIRPQH